MIREKPAPSILSADSIACNKCITIIMHNSLSCAQCRFGLVAPNAVDSSGICSGNLGVCLTDLYLIADCNVIVSDNAACYYYFIACSRVACKLDFRRISVRFYPKMSAAFIKICKDWSGQRKNYDDNKYQDCNFFVYF